MAILVGGHPELSSGKQPLQVDNSGCPPPKKAIIVYCLLMSWFYENDMQKVVLKFHKHRHITSFYLITKIYVVMQPKSL
jgi:hypothetical protein